MCADGRHPKPRKPEGLQSLRKAKARALLWWVCPVGGPGSSGVMGQGLCQFLSLVTDGIVLNLLHKIIIVLQTHIAFWGQDILHH